MKWPTIILYVAAIFVSFSFAKGYNLPEKARLEMTAILLRNLEFDGPEWACIRELIFAHATSNEVLQGVISKETSRKIYECYLPDPADSEDSNAISVGLYILITIVIIGAAGFSAYYYGRKYIPKYLAYRRKQAENAKFDEEIAENAKFDEEIAENE